MKNEKNGLEKKSREKSEDVNSFLCRVDSAIKWACDRPKYQRVLLNSVIVCLGGGQCLHAIRLPSLGQHKRRQVEHATNLKNDSATAVSQPILAREEQPGPLSAEPEPPIQTAVPESNNDFLAPTGMPKFILEQKPDIYTVFRDSEKIDWNESPIVGNTCSVRPRGQAWYPGEHTVELSARINDEDFMQRADFRVRWDCKFEDSLTATDFFINLNKPGTANHVRLDRQIGALVFEQQVLQGDNAWMGTENICETVGRFSIVVHFKLFGGVQSGLQISCPGKLSVQLGDGDLTSVTLKIGRNYLDRSGQIEGLKKRTASIWKLSQPLSKEDDRWFTIDLRDGHLTVSEGADGQIKLLTVPVDKDQLADSRSIGISARNSAALLYELAAS